MAGHLLSLFFYTVKKEPSTSESDLRPQEDPEDRSDADVQVYQITA